MNIKTKLKTKSRTNFSDITNINAYSNSFDFLKNEPDLYTISNVKKNISKAETALVKDKIKTLFL